MVPSQSAVPQISNAQVPNEFTVMFNNDNVKNNKETIFPACSTGDEVIAVHEG